MGILDIFKQELSKTPKLKIKSKKDLLLYMKNNIGVGEEIANLICDAMEHSGRDGYIEFKKGGAGNPYRLEYQDLSKLDSISTKDIMARIKQLQELQSHAASDSEKEHLQKQIAETGGALVTIWINTGSEEDFNSKKRVIKDAYQRCRELCR